MYRKIFIRHDQQADHQCLDPGLKSYQTIINPLQYDYIICSPYRRTRETAILLDKTPIWVDCRIAEYVRCQHLYHSMDPASMIYGPVPGLGETWDHFMSRVISFWNDIKNRQANILVVTHAVVIAFLKAYIFNQIMIWGEVDYLTGFMVMV